MRHNKDEPDSSDSDESLDEAAPPAAAKLDPKKDAVAATPTKSSIKTPPPPPSSTDDEDEEDEDDDEEEDSDSTTGGGAAAKPSAAPPPPQSAAKTPATSKRGRDDKAESQQEGKKTKVDEKGTGGKKKEESKAVGGGKQTKKKEEKKDEQPTVEKEGKDPSKPYFKRTWTTKDESTLAQQLLDDLKAGVDFRAKVKSDNYWSELVETLKPKMEGEYTKDQVFDKYRRLRSKYEKSGAARSRKRTASDEELHNVSKQIWGPESVLPKPANSRGTAMKGGMSDEEESNGEMHTSPLQPKKLDLLVNEASKAAAAAGEGSSQKSPVSSFVASVCSKMTNGYELGSAAAAAAVAGLNGKLRTHILEVMEAECNLMRRQLQVASEVYAHEMELIKKLRKQA